MTSQKKTVKFFNSGCVKGNMLLDSGLYCEVIFLGGRGCHKFASHPVLFGPTICKLNSIFCRHSKLTRDFRPRFPHLKNHSVSHFRRRLVTSLCFKEKVDLTTRFKGRRFSRHDKATRTQNNNNNTHQRSNVA